MRPAGTGWVLMGVAAVDSGQLMVTDPAYIDSQWVKEDYHPSYPIFRLNEAGRERFPGHDLWTWQCFRDDDGNYATRIGFAGMDMNAMREGGLVEEVPQTKMPATSYSYNGACEATLSEEGYGQLDFPLGHEGAGVVFSSGYGDGVYPVYGRYNDDGRIVEVRIVME